MLEPAGNFVPRTWNRDLLLCAAGSGITPVISILKSALSMGRSRIVLLYANRDRGSIIFARQLRELVRRDPRRLTVLHWLESERGIPSARGLAGLVKPYRGYEVYLCGPTGFALVTKQALAQSRISARDIRQEEYRSLTENPFEQPAPAPVVTTTVRPAGDIASVRVEIEGRTHQLPWPRGKKLLDLLLEHGIDAPYVCRESACGTCVCRVERGRTRMLMNEALIDEELDLGLTLACQTLPESDELHITFDQ